MGQETLPFGKKQLKVMDLKNHRSNQFHQIQQQATYRKKTCVFLSNLHFSQHFQTIINRPKKKKKTHGVKKDEYLIEKGRSLRNKAMSLAMLTSKIYRKKMNILP